VAGHNNVIELMQKSFIPHFNATYLTDNSLIKSTGQMIGAPHSFTRSLEDCELTLWPHATQETVRSIRSARRWARRCW
jgi:hypothetical protein